MKLASQWSPLKCLPRKVQEIFLKTIDCLVKCKLKDVCLLLITLIITIINEIYAVDLLFLTLELVSLTFKNSKI